MAPVPVSHAQPQSTYYLALDQGGHSSRAIVFDSAGKIVLQEKQNIGVNRIKPGWVEQDAGQLLASVETVLQRALLRCQEQGIVVNSIGLATQRSNVVCWKKSDGRALSPVISWQDRRAHQWLKQFAEHKQSIHEKTGLFMTAHYGASKLRWCLDHLEAVQQAYDAGDLLWGPLASFLVFHLTRERNHLIDPANATRTLLWSLAQQDWDTGLCHLFGVAEQLLPRSVPSIADYGSIEFSGMIIPLNVVAGDQPAALLAYGTPMIDSAYINMGTGAFIQRPIHGELKLAERLLSGVVMSDGETVQYDLECTINGAGSALTQVENELGIDNQFAEDHFAEWLTQVTDPPLFLNGVSGLGTPYWVADFESRFIGEGTEPEKIVAVAESILFLIQINLQELQSISGPIKLIMLTGGLATSDGLCQRLSSLCGIPVFRPTDGEATARGTAFMLAGCPPGWQEDIQGQAFEPQEDQSLHDRYQRWQTAMAQAITQYEHCL